MGGKSRRDKTSSDSENISTLKNTQSFTPETSKKTNHLKVKMNHVVAAKFWN